MRIWQIIISAGTTFIIISGGALGVALISSDGRPLTKTATIASILTGLVAAAKDVRSLMLLPPLTNGSADALNQLLTKQPLAQVTARNENKTNGQNEPTSRT